MKKTIIAVAACAFLTIVGIFALVYSSNEPKYKRIDISVTTLDGGTNSLENTVGTMTRVESIVSGEFSETMPIYTISQRTITQEEFLRLSKALQVEGEPEQLATGELRITGSNATVFCRNNEFEYDRHENKKAPLEKSDDELVAEAKKIFAGLSLPEAEYQCMGVQSTQTAQHVTQMDNGEVVSGEEYVISKRIVFRRVLDDVRILGDEYYALYFDSDGLYYVRWEAYNYEKRGELPMLSLAEVLERVKEPDVFSLETEGTAFAGKADKLTVEKAKLLYVNQFSNGCTILQPVFNLMGTAENDTGIAEFSAKIIAIPKKYTYTE